MRTPLSGALRAICAVLVALVPRAATAGNLWTPVGPRDVGWVVDVAVAGPVSYAATTDGLFVSRDRGRTWSPTDLSGYYVKEVVAWPGTEIAIANLDLGGIVVTRDGGKTWHDGPPLVFGIAYTVVLDGFRPDTAYLTTLSGVNGGKSIWRTTDAGVTWEPFSNVPYGLPGNSMTVDPRDGTIYLIAEDQFHKSLDGGVDWEQITGPIASPTAIAVGSSGIAYAGRDGQICMSPDAWVSSSCVTFPSIPFRILELPAGDPGGGPEILAASRAGLLASRDGGATWTEIEGALRGEGYLQAVASDATGLLVLAGTASGTFRSDDRGARWDRSSKGLTGIWIRALAVDPHHPTTVWAGGIGFDGSSGPGLFRSADGGASWAQVEDPSGPNSVAAIAFHPDDSSMLYVGGSAVYRSEDGGTSWTSSGPTDATSNFYSGGDSINALAFDAADHFWAATGAGLFGSGDEARVWNHAATAQEIYSMLFDPRRPGAIYAGTYADKIDTYYGPYYIGGLIFESTDGGGTWQKGQRFDGSVVSLAADPFDDRIVYAGLAYVDPPLYRSTDFGTSWVPKGFGTTVGAVFCLIADPAREGTLYAGTADGVYRTQDRGESWAQLSDGLTWWNTYALAITPSGKWLYAGTESGVFRLDLVERALSPPDTPNRTPRALEPRPRAGPSP
jgi:photosystem II stability/assembly factor-like uncharacterized protein